jgi:hypothetical protein
MKRILAGLVLTLMLTGGAAAGPYEDGVAAYERGDYATALRLWRPLAEQGDANAQSNLGFMYEKGRGVPQDEAEAVKWYRLAAEQGYANAQSNLGFMYEKGRGVPQDDGEAVKWYRLAAEQGLARAQYNLGVMYGGGKGVPQDNVQAYMWFDLSARYLEGVERDRTVQIRDIIASKMTPDQIAEAQRLAREWKPK